MCFTLYPSRLSVVREKKIGFCKSCTFVFSTRTWESYRARASSYSPWKRNAKMWRDSRSRTWKKKQNWSPDFCYLVKGAHVPFLCGTDSSASSCGRPVNRNASWEKQKWIRNNMNMQVHNVNLRKQRTSLQLSGAGVRFGAENQWKS